MVEDIRRSQLARVKRLQQACWPRALAGDADAIKVVRWCLDRCATLTGLTRPLG